MMFAIHEYENFEHFSVTFQEELIKYSPTDYIAFNLKKNA